MSKGYDVLSRIYRRIHVILNHHSTFTVQYMYSVFISLLAFKLLFYIIALYIRNFKIPRLIEVKGFRMSISDWFFHPQHA